MNVTAVALAQIIIPLLPTIAGDVSNLVAWISSVRKAAIQNGEWNQQSDAAFRAALEASSQDPAYIMDGEQRPK
jgi:hypothetical protein